MFRKFFATILIIIFIPVICFSVLLFNLQKTLLSPTYLNKSFNQSGIYDTIYHVAPDLVSEMLLKPNDNKLPIASDDLKQLIKDAISPTWIKTNVELIINQTLPYLLGKSYSIDVKIDLKSVKDKFNQIPELMLKSQIASLPECKSIKDYNPQNMQCQPPGINLDDLAKQLSSEASKQVDSSQGNNDIYTILKSIPDNYDLGSLLMQYGSVGPLVVIHQILAFYNLAIALLAAVSILILVFIGLIIYRPWKSILRWIASASLIPGLILSSAFLSTILIKPLLAGLNLNVFTPELTGTVSNLINLIVNGFFKNIYLIGFSMVGLSIIIYIITSFIKSNKEVKSVNLAPKDEKNKE